MADSFTFLNFSFILMFDRCCACNQNLIQKNQNSIDAESYYAEELTEKSNGDELPLETSFAHDGMA